MEPHSVFRGDRMTELISAPKRNYWLLGSSFIPSVHKESSHLPINLEHCVNRNRIPSLPPTIFI